jgi:hypothetical protein
MPEDGITPHGAMGLLMDGNQLLEITKIVDYHQTGI